MDPIYGSNGVTNTALDIDDELIRNNNKSLSENIGRRLVQIEREVIDYDDIQLKYGHKTSKRLTLSANIRRLSLKYWSKFSLISSLCSIFPIIHWLPNYSPKNALMADTMAGMTISILHIPQGIAYSLLAGLDAVNGLYVSFFPVLVYTLMGTSRHISIGSFAVASLMLSSTAGKLGAVEERTLAPNATHADWPPTTLEALTTVCIVTGFVQLAMGCLCLGSLSLILSDHLVSSFSTAVAFHVTTSQMNHILGLSIPNQPSGPLKLIKTWMETLKAIHKTNVATLICSLVLIAILLIFKEWAEPRIKKRFTFPIPIDLIVVILSTLMSWLLDINGRFNVTVVGIIPTGLPEPKIPRLDFIGDVLVDCIIIGIVTFAVSLSLAKIFAKKHKYLVDPNQELIALGSANIFSSFFLSYPASAALSRSTIQEKIGGKTQIAGIVSCLVILVVLLFMAPFLYHLPKATLACVIIVALKAMFLQLGDIKRIWFISKLDAMTWLVTFLSVIFLDVDLGLIFGIGVSLFIILIRLVFPTSSILGALPSTEIYVDINNYKNVKEVYGIKIIRYASPIFYLSRENFKKCLMKAVISFEGFDEETKPQVKPKSLIVDMSCVPFMDTSGIDTLVDIIKLVGEQNISVNLASCPAHVLDIFRRTNFFKSVSPSCVYATVHDAVISLR